MAETALRRVISWPPLEGGCYMRNNSDIPSTRDASSPSIPSWTHIEDLTN